ncbi:hypothetical protein [Herpetosiphon geysericola]|uniref:Uncharacterized protein n=1 Tax=Herpetosiphon geysericola TaxID=70996 RepID=A0A0P6YF09_9CHLR|nr:hypothetical protein [Herpetosiphon geysericola]KPL88896.1 hypothetical protein SE18_09520 [Herpetosiphon geysericola]
MPEEPPYQAETQPSPNSNAGYQAYNQQPAQPSYSSQPRYIVPNATNNYFDAPQRWQRWVGYNALAFGLSCGIMPLGCCIMSIMATVLRHGLQELANNPRFNITEGGAIFILLSFPLFFTICIASLIQRAALDNQVPASRWMLGSALSGIVAMVLAMLLIGAIAALQNLDFTPTSYILSIIGIFAGTSAGIGFFQWWQLRNIMLKAWHWPLIAGATWTGLGTLVLGLGFSYIYVRLKS